MSNAEVADFVLVLMSHTQMIGQKRLVTAMTHSTSASMPEC
jgi:hypothetical protein